MWIFASARRRVVFAALALLVGATALGIRAVHASSDGLHPFPGQSFRMAVPPNWSALSPQQLAHVPVRPLAVVRRRDGRGLLVVRRGRKLPVALDALGKRLVTDFGLRVQGFEKRTSRTLSLGGARSYFFSYATRKDGAVHSIVLVPDGAHSYVINTVGNGSRFDVSRELGRMILSFRR